MRLYNFLNEKLKMDPNLKKMYDRFNSELFQKKLNTELPNNMTLGWRALTRYDGMTTADIQRDPETGKKRYVPEEIVLSTVFDYTEDQLKGVLVHEMIHAYLYMMESKPGHSRRFEELVKYLNKFTDFHIPVQEGIGTKKKKIKEYGIFLIWDKSTENPGVLKVSKETYNKHKNDIIQIIDEFRDRLELVDFGLAKGEILEGLKTRHYPKNRIRWDYVSDKNFEKIKKLLK